MSPVIRKQGKSGRAAGMKITPMLEQYLRAKEEHPDALLFFRMGDFYELFFEDAERAARLMDITLTTRSKKDDVPIPMCGVPHHAVQGYVAKLMNMGHLFVNGFNTVSYNPYVPIVLWIGLGIYIMYTWITSRTKYLYWFYAIIGIVFNLFITWGVLVTYWM